MLNIEYSYTLAQVRHIAEAQSTLTPLERAALDQLDALTQEEEEDDAR